MDKRLALIGIIASPESDKDALNTLLSTYAPYIVGRMGIPYSARDVGVISIVIDAPQTEISALTGKLGMIPGLQTKTLYAREVS